MIRINLLPAKRARKTRTLKLGFQPNVALAVAIVAVILLAEGATWYWLQSSIRGLEEAKLTAERELVVLRKKVQEVENFEKDKKVYEDRIAIIQQLKKNQRGPVKVLDRVSYELPERVWLTSLSQGVDGVVLEGMAMTNDALVQYVTNLKQSRLFQEVQLIESRQIVESNVAVYKFQITFRVNMDLI